MFRKHIIAGCFILFFSLFSCFVFAQDSYELNSGWKCSNISRVKTSGEKLSLVSFPLGDWMNATVPGTVLTTLLDQGRAPDPFYGMNNEKIPDIYTTGREHYTYWFVKEFKEAFPRNAEHVWLHFRGVNYGCEVWLNGKKLNKKTHYGMYLRQTYDISSFLSKDGNNRLAVLVYPPDPVGNPNGGQGGDGTIARNVTHQYVAGWDWIQPVRDRNTGIWDKVELERTGAINIKNPHIITEVPGVRWPDAASQQAALVRVSAELENPGPQPVSGILKYELEGATVSIPVTVGGGSTLEAKLPDHSLANPRLWWPNGYGPQNLYHIRLSFEGSPAVIYDKEDLSFGVREIHNDWNEHTRSSQLMVNGQKLFIKGGNWIVSDELLRLSPGRYDAELRLHRDMNLNLIRVWGGALTERPEFYEACDKYGLLVFQDFWNSGDCNGRWVDPMKKDDQWTRRNYPDDHSLFLASVADQVKLLRNHPSLALWCGGNEITPPDDILQSMKDSILPSLDGTRPFFDYSNSDSMSFNSLGGNGDGPYGIQPISHFWAQRTFPFNSEVGSVGVGDYESLERWLPVENRVAPQYPGKTDPVWAYHKYIGYDSSVYAYGPVKDLRDFTMKAQLVNYDQYRALMEGFSSHMWDWYTGTIIWKTQNPWTALRGQMYDYYLDPNACLYGLHCGSEPLHVMYDPVAGMTMIVNNTFRTHRNLMMEVKTYDMAGKDSLLTQAFFEIGPSVAKKYIGIGPSIDALRRKNGVFLSLRLLDTDKRPVSENFYWLPDAEGNYSGLRDLSKARLKVEARLVAQPKQAAQEKIAVTLTNAAGNPVAFFNRISLVDPATKKRILPVFYSDNYISVPPGTSKTVLVEYTPGKEGAPLVSVKGWNMEEEYYPVIK